MIKQANVPAGITFRTYPSYKSETVTGLKAYAKYQALLLLAMIPIGGGLVLVGVDGMWVFLLVCASLPAALLMGHRASMRLKREVAANGPRAVFDGTSLTLPLHDGTTATLHKGPALHVQAWRYYNSGHGNVPATYGVQIDLTEAGQTYRLWAEGASAQLEELGIERGRTTAERIDHTVRMPMKDALDIFLLMR